MPSNGRPRCSVTRSPYLFVEWHDDRLHLVNADSLRKFDVSPGVVAALSSLNEWTDSDEVAERLGAEQAAALVSCGVLEQAQEPATQPPPPWEPSALAVHRGGGESAGPQRWRGPSPSPFTVIEKGTPTVALPKPASLEMRLEDALGRRRSRRDYRNVSMPLHDLSTALFHSARIVEWAAASANSLFVRHPYASGGGRGELEVYAIPLNVESLLPRCYRYDAFGHCLVEVGAGTSDDPLWSRWIEAATLTRSYPSLVLVITAVFYRVMWKYGSMGLPLLYKNCGCLVQTVYLVAEALDMATCALSAPPEAEICESLNIDPLHESVVSGMTLGYPS